MNRVLLHRELAAILRARGNRWATTADLAAEVNRRGRYKKRDGSAVTAFQVHGRTREYRRIFERMGARVRLLETEPVVPMESSRFYLYLARCALCDLEALRGPQKVGGWTFGKEPLREEMPSDHFRHAVICTVFSAAACEHSLVAVASLRKTTAHGEQRELLLRVWPKKRGWLMGKELVALARALTKVDGTLLTQVEDLMERRNAILHSRAQDWEDPIEDRPGWWERAFQLPEITAALIKNAPGDVRVAEEAVEALQKARGETDWNPFRKPRRS